MPRNTIHSYDYSIIEEQSISAPDSVLTPLTVKELNNNKPRKFSFEEADTSARYIKGHATSQPIAIPGRKTSEQSWQPSFFVGSPSEDPDENPALSRLESSTPTSNAFNLNKSNGGIGYSVNKPRYR